MVEILQKTGKLMGTPLPANPPGITCTICWGIGKPFGNVFTPLFVKVSLSGLLPGEHWDSSLANKLALPATLEQVAIPCDWNLNDGDFVWTFGYVPARSALLVIHTQTNSSVFGAAVAPACQTSLDNQNSQPEGKFAYGGSMEITFF